MNKYRHFIYIASILILTGAIIVFAAGSCHNVADLAGTPGNGTVTGGGDGYSTSDGTITGGGTGGGTVTGGGSGGGTTTGGGTGTGTILGGGTGGGTTGGTGTGTGTGGGTAGGTTGGSSGSGTASGSTSGSTTASLDPLFSSTKTYTFGSSFKGTVWTNAPTDQITSKWSSGKLTPSSTINVIAFVNDHELWWYMPSALSGTAGTIPAFTDPPFNESKIREAMAAFPDKANRRYYEYDAASGLLKVYHVPPESYTSSSMPEWNLAFNNDRANPQIAVFGVGYYPTPQTKTNLGN